MATQTDDELQAIAAKAPASLSNPVNVADHLAMESSQAARTELMRRALTPAFVSPSGVIRPFRFRRNQASLGGGVFGVIRPVRFRHIQAS